MIFSFNVKQKICSLVLSLSSSSRFLQKNHTQKKIEILVFKLRNVAIFSTKKNCLCM